MPAGPSHLAALDAYLRQPVRHWEAGGPPRGPIATVGEPIVRGSRRYSGRDLRPALTVRQRETLAAPIRERQAAAAHWQAEAERVSVGRRAAGALGSFLRGAEAVRQAQSRQPARTLAEQLERLYSALRAERQAWLSVAAAAPYGRSVLDPAYASGTAVNGAETLAGERWQATPWQVRQARTITVPAWAAGWTVKQPLRSAWRQALPQGWLGAEAAAAVERGARWQPLVLDSGEQAEAGSGKRATRQAVRPETAAERGARMRQLLVSAGFTGTAAANAGG